MKALIWLLVLLALAVSLALVIHFNEAYVLLVAPPYRAELSLHHALALGIVVLCFFHLVLRGISVLQSLPLRWIERRNNKQKAQQIENLHACLQLFFEARFDMLEKRAEESEAGAYASLLAAYGAQFQQQAERAKKYLARTQAQAPELANACQLLEAQLLLQCGQASQALAQLAPLESLVAHTPVLMQLKLKAYQALEQWDSVIRLARELITLGGDTTLAQQSLQAAHNAYLEMHAQELSLVRMYIEGLPAEEKNTLLEQKAQRLMAQAFDRNGEIEEALAHYRRS